MEHATDVLGTAVRELQAMWQIDHALSGVENGTIDSAMSAMASLLPFERCVVLSEPAMPLTVARSGWTFVAEIATEDSFRRMDMSEADIDLYTEKLAHHRTSERAFPIEDVADSIGGASRTKWAMVTVSDTNLTVTVTGQDGGKTVVSFEAPHAPLRARHVLYGIQIARSLHDHFASIQRTRLRILTRCTLTPSETQVLHWLTAGKTSWEIGHIIAIPERTVKFHLKNIYRKLNVVNRTQAVAVAGRLTLDGMVNGQSEADGRHHFPLPDIFHRTTGHAA